MRKNMAVLGAAMAALAIRLFRRGQAKQAGRDTSTSLATESVENFTLNQFLGRLEDYNVRLQRLKSHPDYEHEVLNVLWDLVCDLQFFCQNLSVWQSHQRTLADHGDLVSAEALSQVLRMAQRIRAPSSAIYVKLIHPADPVHQHNIWVRADSGPVNMAHLRLMNGMTENGDWTSKQDRTPYQIAAQAFVKQNITALMKALLSMSASALQLGLPWRFPASAWPLLDSYA